MSDGTAKSLNDPDERSKRPMQSIWMSRWTRTSYNSTEATRNHHMSKALVHKELDCISRQYHPINGLDSSRNDNLGTRSRKLRDERLSCEYIPMACPRTFGGISSKAKHGQGADEAVGPSAGTVSLSKPSQEYFVGSSSHTVPYGFDNIKHEFNEGNISASSFTGRSALVLDNQLPNVGPGTVEHEYCNIEGKSAFLAHGRQIGRNSQSKTSGNSLLRESIVPTSLNPAFITDDHLSAFGKDWFQKMEKFCGMLPFPNQSSAFVKTEVNKSHHDCYSLEKLPKCIDDVKTMRIYTTVDSVLEPGGPSRFFHTTHSLLVTKKTDGNLSTEDNIPRDRRVFAEFNRNKSSDFHSLSPYSGQGQQQVKLQQLSSSRDSERQEKFNDDKACKVIIKNESSAETDAMDVDSFRERNQSLSATSAPSDKGIGMDSKLPRKINVSPSREVRCSLSNMLSDRNFELPALPAAASNSTENARPCSSRTQSLDMDVLVVHATHPSDLRSNPIPDGSQKIDPNNRWVKRLKLSTSNHPAHATKISDMGESSSHGKTSRFFRKITKDSATSSEPAIGNCRGKELMLSEKTRGLSAKGGFTKVDPSKNDTDVWVSHAWIQRWLHKGSPLNKMKSKSLVISEPQSSNLAVENLREKQFPSVAAMALMGKAVTGFQPCELQNRGSFMVWNTRAL